MSSWSLLLALSGFHCDLDRGELRFAPQLAASTEADRFTAFWSTDRAWGTYTQRRAADGTWVPSVEVLGGDARGLRVSACGREWELPATSG
jgi:hypothetical protein